MTVRGVAGLAGLQALLAGWLGCGLPPEGARDAAVDGGGADAGDGGAGDAGAHIPGPFTEVGLGAGISFVNRFDPDRFIGSGVCWLDHDGDGDQDLLLAGDYVPSALYRNDGAGHFGDVATAAGLAVGGVVGCAAADVDNDGDADVYLLRTGADRLYVNQGDGRFVDGSATWGLDGDERELGAAAAFGDYDGDGRLDLFVGTYVAGITPMMPFPRAYMGSPNHLLHNVGGRFEEVLTSAAHVDDPTLAAAWIDVDDDGDVDLWVVNDFGLFYAPDRLYRNDGGVLTEVAAEVGLDSKVFGMGAAPGDFDGDGDVDLYETNLMSNLLHVQQGGRFTDGAAAAGVRGHGFSDPAQGVPVYRVYDPGASLFDAAMAGFMAAYTDPASGEWGATGWGAVWLDFDQDGVLDLFVANGRVHSEELVPEGERQPDMLWRGVGGGRLVMEAPGSDAWDRGEARGAAAADYDGDGDLDLAVGIGSMPTPGRTLLLRNDGARGGWLEVRLRGVVSNRDGIGARVRVTPVDGAGTAVGAPQTRWRFGGGSFASTGAPGLHFGLGAATRGDVEVRWPSGARDVMRGVAAGRGVVVMEGSAPP